MRSRGELWGDKVCERGEAEDAGHDLVFASESGSPSRGMSTSILTRTISLPPFAKNARSSARKKPLVGPVSIFTGGAGGNSAMSSCPVGGAGYFRDCALG